MKIPYRKVYSDYSYDWVPLKMTGRWKYVSNPYCDNTIFIEYYWGFFNLLRAWIREENIEFLEETKEEMFNCNRNY